uniref:Uncharacterized protein n=1 Tax=Oscillatoriales cyanobacterium SpSt-402 TaxID=2282168 RepID=A0A832H2T3_9CYAN
MASVNLKRFTWVSLTLLFICYTWFGWYLSGLQAKPAWLRAACYRILSAPTQQAVIQPAQAFYLAEQPSQQAWFSSSQSVCNTIIERNLLAALLAIGWIFLSSMAFISPLTSFSSFLSHWFKSDTVAFMTLFMFASLAAVILYWLHIFLQILTILAVDVLARIDIQCLGLSGVQAFWILVSISLTGLAIGWAGNTVF